MTEQSRRKMGWKGWTVVAVLVLMLYPLSVIPFFWVCHVLVRNDFMDAKDATALYFAIYGPFNRVLPLFPEVMRPE